MSARHRFWIYWDKKTKRVRIHLAKCGACQDGYGSRDDDHDFGIAYGWKGANSYRPHSILPVKSSMNFAVKAR